MRVVKSEEEILGQRVVYLTSEEDGLRVGIAPGRGGEISSFQYRWKDEWRELLYRANQFEPTSDIWRGRAPWLFPAAGRNFTPEQVERLKLSGGDSRMGGYHFAGRDFAIPCHGFVMEREWEVADSPDVITCTTRSDEDTRQCFPFDYRLDVTFSLLSDGLAATACIAADACNQDEMFFSIGNHITVVTPFTDAGSAGSCLVRTPAKARPEISPQSVFSGTMTPVNYASGVALKDDLSLFNMVLSQFPISDYHVDVLDPASFGLRVRQREIVPEGGEPKTAHDSFYFVFYGNLERGYFCPEPWYGGPNSFNDQRGVVRLKPGEQCVWEMTVGMIQV